MQLRGLHHVTAICRDPERTIAFYRDLMGLAVVHDGPSDDDPESRHVWFGAQDGRPGHARLVHAVPRAAEGRRRRRLDAPLRVRGRTAPRSRRRGATTCAARASSAPTSSTAAPSARSTSATPTGTSSRSRPAGPASRRRSVRGGRADRRRSPAVLPASSRPAGAGHGERVHRRRLRDVAARRAASARRWRSVIEPTVFVSDMGIEARNRRQRVRPQRCWLSSRSAIAMLSASHGHSSTMSATVVSPSATCRLSSPGPGGHDSPERARACAAAQGPSLLRPLNLPAARRPRRAWS